MKGFALGLALKQSRKAAQKSTIVFAVIRVSATCNCNCILCKIGSQLLLVYSAHAPRSQGLFPTSLGKRPWERGWLMRDPVDELTILVFGQPALIWNLD